MTHKLLQHHPAHRLALMTALFFATPTCAPTKAPITTGTQFMALDIVSAQAARCTQSQGIWYAGLLCCACPAETLFHPSDGCRKAGPWQVETPPTPSGRTTWRMEALHVTSQTPAPTPQAAPNPQAASTPPNIYAQRLTWPTSTAPHTLSDALACDIEAAHAVWVRGDFSSVGPHVSLWHARTTRRPTLKKACGTYLAAHGFRHGDALCDTAIAMQRELRRRGTTHKRGASPWERIAHVTLPEPGLAHITAQWKSPVTCATYVIHVREEGALQRHISIHAAEQEELVLFLDATGGVTAGAAHKLLDQADAPMYFDAYFAEVIPA